jgi:excisionase family DNA binding protein
MNTELLYIEKLPLTLRVDDLMPILGIGRNTAYRLVRTGEIRSIRIGRQIRIPRQFLIDFLNQK